MSSDLEGKSRQVRKASLHFFKIILPAFNLFFSLKFIIIILIIILPWFLCNFSKKKKKYPSY